MYFFSTPLLLSKIFLFCFLYSPFIPFPPLFLFSFTLSTFACFSPVALHLCPFIRADVYGEHVVVLGVVPALLPPHAVCPSLPPPLPPLLHQHAASLSYAARGAQGLYGGPGALLPHQGRAHQKGSVWQDRRGGQVGGNHFLLWRETEVKQWMKSLKFTRMWPVWKERGGFSRTHVRR